MSAKPVNVVVLAAGQGKRMHSDLPKVLHRLAGKPLLEHVLDAARAAATGHYCVVCGHGGEQVRLAIGADNLNWAVQEPQLGTGHAVLQAMPCLAPDLPTLVLYGDVPLIRAATIKRLIELSEPDCLVLLTVVLDDPHGYGRIVRIDGEVQRIVEEKDADDAERVIKEVNTGILIAPQGKLQQWLPALKNSNAQGEYYLTDIVALAVAEGMRIQTVHPEAVWEAKGVNSKRQLADLERIFQRNQADTLLDAGVTLADPARLDVRGELGCGLDVFIDVNCVFEGKVHLGDGVMVGPHCVLSNVEVKRGARINAFCHLSDAVVGEAAIIGPYARLRPGTVLGTGVHVGNFVEVKNSSIADDSKANHLAYVGDATVGRRVNIGAGTITCNYDGAEKHRTIIEDDVQIGSDTQLVAPVTVGRGATLGAGTTLTEDAPPGQLTISRVRQVSIANWKRPTKKSK